MEPGGSWNKNDTITTTTLWEVGGRHRKRKGWLSWHALTCIILFDDHGGPVRLMLLLFLCSRNDEENEVWNKCLEHPINIWANHIPGDSPKIGHLGSDDSQDLDVSQYDSGAQLLPLHTLLSFCLLKIRKNVSDPGRALVGAWYQKRAREE